MKMVCTYCNGVDECPCGKDHSDEFKDGKYACDVCTALLEEGAKEEELRAHPRREMTRKRIETEFFADAATEAVMAEFSGPFWKMAKKDTGGMSKKDIAMAAYEAGAHIAFLTIARIAGDENIEKRFNEAIATQKGHGSGQAE